MYGIDEAEDELLELFEDTDISAKDSVEATQLVPFAHLASGAASHGKDFDEDKQMVVMKSWLTDEYSEDVADAVFEVGKKHERLYR